MGLDPDQRKFANKLLQSFISALMTRAIWGLPWSVAVGLLALAIGAAFYFKMY
jgi:hypothetical protein